MGESLSGMAGGPNLSRLALAAGTRVVRGDFRDLYRQNFAFVWRSARGLGVRPADLDDVVQEVFVAAHRRFDEFEHRSSVKTWLFAITHRVILNYRRSLRRKVDPVPLSNSLICNSPSPMQHAERAEAISFVYRFLDGLDSDKRAVFVCCVLEEMTAPEAAEALGARLNTIYSRLRVVRARFRDALERWQQGVR